MLPLFMVLQKTLKTLTMLSYFSMHQPKHSRLVFPKQLHWKKMIQGVSKQFLHFVYLLIPLAPKFRRPFPWYRNLTR